MFANSADLFIRSCWNHEIYIPLACGFWWDRYASCTIVINELNGGSRPLQHSWLITRSNWFVLLREEVWFIPHETVITVQLSAFVHFYLLSSPVRRKLADVFARRNWVKFLISPVSNRNLIGATPRLFARMIRRPYGPVVNSVLPRAVFVRPCTLLGVSDLF